MTHSQKRKAKLAERNKSTNANDNIYIVNGPGNPSKRTTVSSTAKEKELVKNVEELVDAILTQQKPYVLPRYAGAFVAPHQYRWKKAIALDDPMKFKTSMLFSNNLDNVLSIGQHSASDITIAFQSLSNVPTNPCTYPSGEVCYDYTLTLENGRSYKSSSLPVAGYSHWSNSRSSFVPGFKYYRGRWGASNTDPLILSFYNAAKTTGSVTFNVGVVVDGAPQTRLSHIASLEQNVTSYNFLDHANYDDFQTEVMLPTTEGYFFTVAVQSSGPNNNQPYGNHIGLQLGPITISSPITWAKYSLWDLMADGQIAHAQYMKSSRHNVTGNIVTLTNTTAELYKGGNIFAARLPGNSYNDLGASTDDIIKVVSSQVDHVLESSDLARGMSYSFTPEKIQDWLFERHQSSDPFQGNPENLPYCAVAIDASGVNASAVPTFMLTGVISVEYLTVDPSNWKVSSPSNSVIFDAILNALATENCVSCNPDHIDHLKRVVKKVMTTDNLKYAVKTLISTGVKVAPFVLSLL